MRTMVSISESNEQTCNILIHVQDRTDLLVDGMGVRRNGKNQG